MAGTTYALLDVYKRIPLLLLNMHVCGCGLLNQDIPSSFVELHS